MCHGTIRNLSGINEAGPGVDIIVIGLLLHGIELPIFFCELTQSLLLQIQFCDDLLQLLGPLMILLTL